MCSLTKGASLRLPTPRWPHTPRALHSLCKVPRPVKPGAPTKSPPSRCNNTSGLSPDPPPTPSPVVVVLVLVSYFPLYYHEIDYETVLLDNTALLV